MMLVALPQRVLRGRLQNLEHDYPVCRICRHDACDDCPIDAELRQRALEDSYGIYQHLDRRLVSGERSGAGSYDEAAIFLAGALGLTALVPDRERNQVWIFALRRVPLEKGVAGFFLCQHLAFPSGDPPAFV